LPAVLEQQIKKCCGDKLVLGCFFNLGSAAFVGCVLESTGKYGKVLERKKCRKVLKD